MCLWKLIAKPIPGGCHWFGEIYRYRRFDAPHQFEFGGGGARAGRFRIDLAIDYVATESASATSDRSPIDVRLLWQKTIQPRLVSAILHQNRWK